MLNTKVTLLMTFRDRQALFFGFGFPLLVAFALGAVFGPQDPKERINIIMQIIAINITASGLFGVAIPLVTMREQHILRRYRVTPMPLMLFLLSHILAQVIVMAFAAVLQLLLLSWMMKVPLRLPWGKFWAVWFVGAFTLVSLGVVAASFADTTKAVNAIIQILFLPMLFLSGATIPWSFIPPFWQRVGEFLPLTHLVRALKAVSAGKDGATLTLPLLALGITAGIGLFFAHTLFRWDPEERMTTPARLRIAAAALLLLILPKGVNAVIALWRLPRGTVIIHAGQMWDGRSERVLKRVTIFIRDGRIVGVRKGFLSPPGRSTFVDARSLTVLPGLGDAHIHLGGSGGFLFFPQ